MINCCFTSSEHLFQLYSWPSSRLGLKTGVPRENQWPLSSTNKTDRYNIIEILLKVVLNTITLTFKSRHRYMSPIRSSTVHKYGMLLIWEAHLSLSKCLYGQSTFVLDGNVYKQSCEYWWQLVALGWHEEGRCTRLKNITLNQQNWY